MKSEDVTRIGFELRTTVLLVKNNMVPVTSNDGASGSYHVSDFLCQSSRLLFPETPANPSLTKQDSRPSHPFCPWVICLCKFTIQFPVCMVSNLFFTSTKLGYVHLTILPVPRDSGDVSSPPRLQPSRLRIIYSPLAHL